MELKEVSSILQQTTVFLTDKFYNMEPNKIPAKGKIGKLDRLHLDNLEEYFSNLTKKERPSFRLSVEYSVGNDSFGFLLEDRYTPDLVIFIDNFPGPRRNYRSSLPIKTFEDLVYNLSQAGIILRTTEKAKKIKEQEGK